MKTKPQKILKGWTPARHTRYALKNLPEGWVHVDIDPVMMGDQYWIGYLYPKCKDDTGKWCLVTESDIKRNPRVSDWMCIIRKEVEGSGLVGSF